MILYSAAKPKSFLSKNRTITIYATAENTDLRLKSYNKSSIYRIKTMQVKTPLCFVNLTKNISNLYRYWWIIQM
jgi:hypothetical protein